MKSFRIVKEGDQFKLTESRDLQKEELFLDKHYHNVHVIKNTNDGLIHKSRNLKNNDVIKNIMDTLGVESDYLYDYQFFIFEDIVNNNQ